MNHREAITAVLAAPLLGATVPAQAKDLLDYVIEAVDPTLAPARPLIECLAGGGAAEECAVEAAKRQASGALPIGPGDDRVQKAAKVFAAARDERWLDVVKIGGEVVAKSVSCAVLPVQGPLKGTACGIVGWVITKNAGALDKAYQALKGPDWWALVELLGPGVCEMVPGDGPAGLARDVLCGPLAQVLVELKQWADAVGKGAVAGADALENLVFGDDSHMPYHRYFALYWRPWYHYSTARVFMGQGDGLGRVYDGCVDYFDSHNQYRSTARKTRGDLRNKFDKHVQGFAAALPVAVDGYFETVARPAIRTAATLSYGKPAALPLPGEDFFVQNCELQMRIRIPFPEPSEVPCMVLADKAKGLGKASGGFGGQFGPLYKAMAASCYKDVKAQDPQPSVWALACEDMRPRYGQIFAGETLRLAKAIGELKKEGCQLAIGGNGGPRLSCGTYAAYSDCLGKFHPNGKKYCSTPPKQLLDVRATQAAGPAATDAPLAGPVAEAAPPLGKPRGRLDTGAIAIAAGRLRQDVVIVEAETLFASGRFQLRGGQLVAQSMGGFGPGWSGDAQLFWHGGAPGAALDLLVDVPRDGAWVVEIDLTRAPDYGQLAFEVDQHRVSDGFDGYASGVAGPVKVSLGTFAMRRGERPVSLMITGRGRSSTGFLVGVDRIRLRPSGS
jgi:hypothetical protein